MKTHELLELASLDAMGLLDDNERAAFEAGFLAAAPALQAQIRREQARMAGSTQLLPNVESPLGLRARVLAAVRDAMHAVASGRDVGEGFVPGLAPSRGVSALWRAGAIGLAAASIVLGFSTLQIRSYFREYSNASAANALSARWAQEFGVKFQQMLLDPSTRFVQFKTAAFSPSRPGIPGAARATILLNGETGSGLFVCKDYALNPADTFVLRVVDKDGKELRGVLTFEGNSANVLNHQVSGLTLNDGESLEIISMSGGQPILKGGLNHAN